MGQKQNELLIPVFKGGKYGYIDISGEIVINPQFRAAYDFSEGLACVRKDGLYGYINLEGNWVIQPKYDFGTEFSKGAALVWVDAKPQLINIRGKVIYWTNEETKAKNVGEGLFKFSKRGSKELLVNNKGLRISTHNTYYINDFVNGKAVVYTKAKSSSKVGRFYHNAGLIDENGNSLIDFGKYYAIFNYTNSQISAAIANKEGSFTVHYFDENLNIVASIKSSYVGRPHHGFSEGLRAIRIAAPPLNSSENDYQGFINLKGDTIINNEEYIFVEPFSNGVSIASSRNRDRFLINSSGEKLSNKIYFNFLQPTSINNRLFAESNNSWDIINSNEDVIHHLDNEFLFERVIGNKYLIYTRKKGRFNYNDNLNKDFYMSGLMDMNGKIIIKADKYLRIYGIRGDHLIYASNDKYYLIYNLNGKIIYQTPKSKTKATTNIDYKSRINYSVQSRSHESDIGGFAKSENHSVPINNNKITNKLVLKFNQSLNEISVVNSTNQTQYFNGINSCLYLCLEAKNKHREWKAVEMYPRSWCGNSYHTLQLESGNQWVLKSRKYEGAFQTKLRYSLKVLTEEPSLNKKTPESYFVYSDEFEGSINPAQFWRIKPYYSSGLMDANY